LMLRRCADPLRADASILQDYAQRSSKMYGGAKSAAL
jgi:hypothetical protein